LTLVVVVAVSEFLRDRPDMSTAKSRLASKRKREEGRERRAKGKIGEKHRGKSEATHFVKATLIRE